MKRVNAFKDGAQKLSLLGQGERGGRMIQMDDAMKNQTERIMDLCCTQLAWLIHITGEVVACKINQNSSQSNQTIDGYLSSYVFDLIKFASPLQIEHTPPYEKLTVAILHFSSGFRNKYITGSGTSSTDVCSFI